jgi:hypothetical protein
MGQANPLAFASKTPAGIPPPTGIMNNFSTENNIDTGKSIRESPYSITF